MTSPIISDRFSIQEAIEYLNRQDLRQAMVHDVHGTFLGVLADRDLRQAIIERIPQHQPIAQLLLTRDGSDVRPVQAIEQSAPPIPSDSRAVVMAGGFGTRLGALTEATPKPMLPIGGKPVLAHIVEHLRDSGITRITLATHFMPEKICDHFGNGAAFGVQIDYVHETTPLGTAGALGLLGSPAPPDSTAPLLVVNGDLLTSVNFRSMLDFHREHNAALTVAARVLEHRIPYGVLETDGPRITGLNEKPVQHHLINAGIYLLQPPVLAHIPPGVRFDMTDLIARLLDNGERVAGFPLIETWLDIGMLDDYNRAQVQVLDKEIQP